MACTSVSSLRRLSLFCRYCSTSAILNEGPVGGEGSTVLTRQEKSRTVLSLLKSEENPERILEICHAACLTLESQVERACFFVAVSKLKGSNHFEEIRRLLEEHRRSHLDLKTEQFAALSIVLYCKAGMIDDAVATFEHIDSIGIQRTVKTLNTLLSGCISANEYDRAQKIFAQFPQKYDIMPNLDTYNLVIKALCESGSSSSGYSVVASMESAGIKPNATTFGRLVAGFHAEGKLEDVERVMKMRDGRGIKHGLEIYDFKIQSLCKRKRTSEARAFLNTMLLIRGMEVKSPTYMHLIHGFCKEGKLEDAKKVLERMRDNGCKPDSQCYFIMIYFLANDGDYETALRFCKECITELNRIPNFTTMKLLVDGLISISKFEEARELIRQMRDKFPHRASIWKETEESCTQLLEKHVSNA